MTSIAMRTPRDNAIVRSILLAVGILVAGLAAPCQGQVAPSVPAVSLAAYVQRWLPTGNLNVARSGHTATLLADGKVMVVGGERDNGAAPSTAELFDPSAGTWSATGRLNAAHIGHTATLLPDGRVLVYGGVYANGYGIADSPYHAELYDPATGTWRAAGSAADRGDHSATLLKSGKILIVGGNGIAGIQASSLYDPATDSWSNTGPIAHQRFAHQATLLQDGRVLVTGGAVDTDLVCGDDTAELYDPVAGTWKYAAPMKTRHCDHKATLLPDGRVLIAGGATSTGEITFPYNELKVFPAMVAELFDPETGTWTNTGSLNVERGGLQTASLLPDGNVLVVGGSSGADWSLPPLQSTEIYDRNSAKWVVTESLAIGRGSHSATRLLDGRILVAGGGGAAGRTAEIFTNLSLASNSFRMTAMFTDQVGLYQYIQLQELFGLNDQHHFTGLTLTSKSRNGVVKTVAFPNDLPESNTAGRYVMIGTTLGPPVDFALPAGFIPTDGGTLTFAGIDVWEYPVLPADGHAVLLRDNTFASSPPLVVALIFRSFGGSFTGLSIQQDPVIEYYNALLDHYFITASQPDIDALDSHRTPGWTRTGEYFLAYISTGLEGLGWPPNLREVCRFWIPPAVGDSHFFSVLPAECAAAKAIPGYVLETNKAFYASLPNEQSGECFYDQIPLYRLWNGRFDSNHRYTRSSAIRDLMVGKGYIAEGYGPNAVAMCVGGGIPSGN